MLPKGKTFLGLVTFNCNFSRRLERRLRLPLDTTQHVFFFQNGSVLRLILGKIGFQSDEIPAATAARWSGNTCPPSNQPIITSISNVAYKTFVCCRKLKNSSHLIFFQTCIVKKLNFLSGKSYDRMRNVKNQYLASLNLPNKTKNLLGFLI